MAIRLVEQVLDMPELTEPTVTLVALAIAERCSKLEPGSVEGYCFPSQRDIARRARISERQARRIIGQLEQIVLSDGRPFLQVNRQHGPNRSSRYTMALPKPDASVRLSPGIPDTHDRQYRTSPTQNRTRVTRIPDIAMSAEPIRTVNTEPSFNPIELARMVAVELGFCGNANLNTLGNVVTYELEKLGRDPDTVVGYLIGQWEAYQRSSHARTQFTFKTRPLKFFADGVYRQPETWEVENEPHSGTNRRAATRNEQSASALDAVFGCGVPEEDARTNDPA